MHYLSCGFSKKLDWDQGTTLRQKVKKDQREIPKQGSFQLYFREEGREHTEMRQMEYLKDLKLSRKEFKCIGTESSFGVDVNLSMPTTDITLGKSGI